MKIAYLKNFRKGLATNSSSTHSLIYRNENELFEDLNIFELNYYDRCDNTIAASRSAKIKYILANIMYNDDLVKIMSAFYPEMKEYYPLIKESMTKDDYTFGCYGRGDLNFINNIEASVDYLRNIIDNPEIIIIGGSDEQEFVYDKSENHIQCPDPEMIEYKYNGYYINKSVTKNGNYWVGFGETNDKIVVSSESSEYHHDDPIKHSFQGKIRFVTENNTECIPDFPELIDLKITNKCDHGCKFCFMDSNMKGKHADIGFLRSVVDQCGNVNESNEHRVEFSIGGGNILLYPHLEEFLKYVHKNGHIANVTINAQDCDKILNSSKLKRIFDDYVDGIGISVTSIADVDLIKNFCNVFDIYDIKGNYKFISIHLIPEYLGASLTKQIQDYLRKSKIFAQCLMLGYKTNGRGENCQYHVFTDDELKYMFKDAYNVHVDTTFANRYFEWIKNNFSYELTITLNEGEYSMYIDGVEEKAYKSSYQLDKPYNMHVDYKHYDDNPWFNVKKAFNKIRKDNGFKVFDKNENSYWSDAN